MNKAMANHAIIVGGGLAGLLTARVLCDHFKKVTVLEKDLITSANMFEVRQGVPQATQAHFLTTTGVKIIQELFPGFEESLLTRGAHKAFLIQEWKHFQQNHWMPQYKTDKVFFVQSRPLLEGCIRSLLVDENIHFLYQYEVTGLLANPKENRVTGVRTRNLQNNEEENMYADLIVDASGRNALFPAWLEGLGFSKPEKEEVKIDVAYVSRKFLLPKEYQPDWKLMTIFRNIPHKKSATATLLESTTHENLCLVTLMGQHGDIPVNSEEGFFEFARQLDTPVLYDLLQRSKPIGPCIPFKIPSGWRYRYSTAMKRPTGFISLGDALCATNPIYAQGMSAVALAAKFLADLLEAHPDGTVDNICKKYFNRIESVISTPWNSTTFIDFLYPETVGKRPIGFGFMKWYNKLMLKASEDPFVWGRMVEVKNLERSPLSLYSPGMLVRVLPKMFSR